jgi:putative protease
MLLCKSDKKACPERFDCAHRRQGQRVELAAPAGDKAALKTAVNEGADSVYFGVKGLNMRNLAENFDLLEIKKVMQFLHAHKVRGYLALNTIALSNDLTKAEKILRAAKAAKVDAVILWDMGIFSLAKKMGLKIHLSTQAGVSNIEAVRFFVNAGVKRIVLARECTIADIKKIASLIKKEKLNCELEVFVHGAMCVSLSGRCFLSHHSFAKSANKGECLQPCRREYLIKDIENEAEYIVGRDYLLSPKDLCTIDFADQLIEAGVKAFKIEGRRRSPEYVKVVTASYRKAIDAYYGGELTDKLKATLKDDLSRVYNRGFSDGFYFGEPANWISRGLAQTHEKIFLGDVTKFYKKISVAEIIVRNSIVNVGQNLLFTGKNTPAAFAEVVEMQKDHQPVEKAGPGEYVAVKLPFEAHRGDKVFIWREKEI